MFIIIRIIITLQINTFYSSKVMADSIFVTGLLDDLISDIKKQQLTRYTINFFSSQRRPFYEKYNMIIQGIDDWIKTKEEESVR